MDNPVAIVTGASQGIGRSTAIRLARDFSVIVLVARNGDALEEAAEAVRNGGAESLSIALDLSRVESPETVLKTILDRYGRVDALLNIAGAVPQIDLFEMTDEQWYAGMELKLHGARRLTIRAWDALKASKGSVVFMSGSAALDPKPGFAAVAATNAAIRHVCGRRYLGQRKVDAVADVLLDRNPALEIERHDTDLMTCPDLADHVRRSSVVALATDNDPTRYRLNQLCVDTKTAFVIGKVFTRGIGGEVFNYRPGESGCLACLESVLERLPYRDGVREIDLVSDEERQKMYGLEIPEIKDSPGLNVDIAFITAFHTRFVLDAIARTLPERPKFLPPIEKNYLVWGNRPVHPFTKHFELQRIQVHPQQGCLICADGDSE